MHGGDYYEAYAFCSLHSIYRWQPERAEACLAAIAGTNALPQRLIGDKAYDSDPLDVRLREQHNIEMIAPNRRKRKKAQDGRPLRRYLRRWKIERLFAWLKNFRRLTSRWERYATNFLGMVQLGCTLILLRHL